MASLKLNRIAFIVSKKDLAGINMRKYLLSLYNYEEIDEDIVHIEDKGFYLFSVDEDIIYVDNVEKIIPFDADVIIFLSRHSSERGLSTLSVHVSGNPTGEASYGGSPYELANSHPILMGSTLKYMDRFNRERGLGYKVSLEVTHHGPTKISIPSFFVEVGSTPKQWRDRAAIEVAVDSVLHALENPINGDVAAGFGGPHYAPTFTRYCLEKEFVFGHILSKYALENTRDDIIISCFSKTFGSRLAVIDWKGIRGEYRRRLYDFLVDRGYEIIKA